MPRLFSPSSPRSVVYASSDHSSAVGRPCFQPLTVPPRFFIIFEKSPVRAKESKMKNTKKRCRWVESKSEIYLDYHDKEWGRPQYRDDYLYEMFLLETFQAGLSWITILNKRENFRKAFDNFAVEKIARYDEKKVERLLDDPGIIRNRGKIEAAVVNAKICLEIRKEFGSFSKYIWNFTDGKSVVNRDDQFRDRTKLSDSISSDLKKRGMKFVGSVTIYSYLQAIGVVNDHDKACFCHP